MSFKTEFFAPVTRTVPNRCCPPVILKTSTYESYERWP